ncbi:aminoacyl-tRNA deacylase [Anaerobaca lacustris]|uniref:YbaK/EbsC family protein n=1 Tax=Anaerobaca lacustris TaxID=3044600 RepID=A0AAW6U0Y3_9BACT|nr:YbaK/EbsC family protein [Sedimentisphaerales bacterium M17dextr]
MQITEFLDKSGVKYEVLEHRPVFSAQRLAQIEHEPGRFVAKPVIVKADGRFLMCVLPADAKIDLETLKGQLDAESVELADEEDFAELFPDCEVGAEPPFGSLFHLETVMDKALEKDDHILFRAGSHTKAVRLNMADYRKLAHPRVLNLHR